MLVALGKGNEAMTASDPYSTLRGAKAAEFFEPYARLVQVLYPRATGVAVFDPAGEPLWQKQPDLEASLKATVQAFVQNANDPERSELQGIHRMLQASIPAYLFWLREERGPPVGIVAVTGKAPAMNSPPPTLPEIEKSLQPVLVCVARELGALRRLPSTDQQRLVKSLEQSDWVAGKLLPLVNDGVQKEPIRAMLRSLVDYTDASIGALVLPARSLCLVAEPDGWNNEQAHEALRRTHRRVMAHVQKKLTPFVSNRVGESAGAGESYRLIAVPLLIGPTQAAGYLALLKSSIGSDFGPPEQRLLERIAPVLRALADRDYDSLTALRNPASFEQAARRMLPADGVPASSLIVVDIAGLGEINHKLGANAGDRVIGRVAKLLRPPRVPQGTLSSRQSGGRFACLLPRRDAEEAERVAESIRESARKLAAAKDSKVMEVRLRTGVATVAGGESGLRDALIEGHAAVCAAQAILAASSGRHEQAGAPRSRSARQMVPMFLREALREERMRVFAQPMHALRDPRRPVRLELLARILDENDRLVTPMEFLAAGPDPDAMAEMDRSVMTLAMEILVEHAAILARQRVEFSLNVSGRSLEITEFHDWICQQLRRGVVPADAWLFEIPETVAARQPRDVERFARRVMSVGARVVLDDVGSAGVDAVRLRTHHASAIKMDGSLIRDLADDPRAQRLVEALTQWANASRMETVAEQVESELVRDQLGRFGIDYVQGYLVGEPRPLALVLDDLASAAEAKQAASA